MVRRISVCIGIGLASLAMAARAAAVAAVAARP